MNFNGDTPGDFSDGGLMTGSLEITDDLTVGDSITLDGKYTLPVTAPLGPNSVITSDGTDQIIWTGDLSVGDVSSITTSTVDGEIVLFNGEGGKSVKNSSKVISDFITNPLDRTTNDAAAAEISVRKSHGPGGYVLNGDQITRYSSSAFRQLSSIYAYTGWHQWEATEDHINSSGSKYSVWSTNNGDTMAQRKLEIDTSGIAMLDTLSVKSGIVNIDAAVNSVINYSLSDVPKWQVGAIGSDNYEIKNENTTNIALSIDSATDTITTSGKMLVGGDLEADGELLLKNSGVLEAKITAISNGTLIVTDVNGDGVLRLGGFLNQFNYSGDDNTPVFISARKTRGTRAAPTAILNGDNIRLDYALGHDGVGLNVGVQRYVKATENWSPGNNGSSYSIQTCNNGSSVEVERFLIDTAGTHIKTDLNVDGNVSVNEGFINIDTSSDSLISYDRDSTYKWLVGNKLASSDAFVFTNSTAVDTIVIEQGATTTKLNISEAGVNSIGPLFAESGLTLNTGSNAFSMPPDRGTDAQILTTDGAGLTSWTTLPHNVLGELYISGNATNTVISNIGQYTPLAGTFTMSYNNGFLAATAPIFTYQGGGERIFKIDSTFSFNAVTGGTGITWSFALFRNGALLPGSITERRTDGTTDIVSASLCNFVTLANTDFVAVRIANLTNTTDILVKHMAYNIIGLT